MEWIEAWWTALWQLSAAMAPYIILGLFIAGIMHEAVPESFVKKHLGSDAISSVIKATLLGIPLPVCSCGVIPLAASLKRQGASNGATLAFLVSTPITGIDSILATYGIFGAFFTFYRVVSSVIIAVVAGIAVNVAGVPVRSVTPSFSVALPSKKEAKAVSCCTSTSCCGTIETSRRFSLKKAMRYGFVTLADDIAEALIWGLVIAAFITVTLPEDMSLFLRDYPFLGYIVALGVALPMYVCATASLPVAAALILSGVSAGAAFIFLTAGPATNTVTMGVVKKMLGMRALVIYLVSLVLGSTAFGFGLDMLFAHIDIDPTSLVRNSDENTFWSAVSAVVLWGWMIGRKVMR